MGVLKLEQYIYHDAPSGIIKSISIKQEIEAHFANNEKAPLIIVDLAYFLNGLQKNSREEQLCGGRLHYYLRDIESFFGKLKYLGVHLVFFSNCYTKDEDFEKWSERAENRYEKEISVLDLIYQGATLEAVTQYCLANKIYVSLQKLTHPAIYEIARRNGRIFRAYDVTRSVAAYAKANNAFAVLGCNTDYLIFDGNWRYWNSSKLKLRNMSTVEMDKEQLRNHFRLSSDQMVLLATLMGNHIIEEAAVQKFHSMLPTKPVAAVANFIRVSTENQPTKDDLETVTIIAFERRYDKNKIEESIEFYSVPMNFTEPKIDGNKLINQLYYETDLFSYQVLTNKFIYTSLQFVDLRKGDIPSYPELILNLRRKCVGLLVKNKPGLKQSQTFVTKLNHDEGFTKIEVEPIYPTYFVPSLTDLFTPLIDKTIPRTLKNERYDLIKFLISEKLTPSTINSIPKQYLTTALTILYMFDQKCLTIDEADIFTLSTYAVVMKWIPGNILPPETLHPRAFRLAFMFLRMSEHIRRCFIIAGLAHLNDGIHYDGYHFHNTYNKFIHESDEGKKNMMISTPTYVQLYRTLNNLPVIGGKTAFKRTNLN